MNTLFQTLKNDWSISATVAGFLAVLISYSGPLIIFDFMDLGNFYWCCTCRYFLID